MLTRKAKGGKTTRQSGSSESGSVPWNTGLPRYAYGKRGAMMMMMTMMIMMVMTMMNINNNNNSK